MLGPSSKDGTRESGDSVACAGRVGRPTVGTTETVVPIVGIVSTVGGDKRHGGSTIAAAPTVARPPPRTKPMRESAPSRNRTEEVATTAPPAQRRKTKSTTTCCDCTRHSTCTSVGAKSRPGCACLLARRKCSGCAFFRQCQNKRPNLPEAANNRHSGSTLRAYFPSSQAAETDSTGGLLTQPPLPDGNDAPGTATDRTDAAPLPRATTTTAAPSQGYDDDNDDEDAPAAEPDADPGPQPEDIGDPFLPNLPDEVLRLPRSAPFCAKNRGPTSRASSLGQPTSSSTPSTETGRMRMTAVTETEVSREMRPGSDDGDGLSTCQQPTIPSRKEKWAVAFWPSSRVSSAASVRALGTPSDPWCMWPSYCRRCQGSSEPGTSGAGSSTG
jgi:hypothetical protein